MGGPPPLPATEGQTYCLRWNNHKSNLVEILDALIKVESYVDCTIVVDDQVQFKAHRVVLAANSPYFQSILQDVPMDHCSIIFPGVKAFEMRALLEYMYTGEVNVTQSQIPKIMRIAEELEVKGLFDMADLKEKFNKLGEEHTERINMPPYTSSLTAAAPYTSTTTSAAASSTAAATAQNGGKDHHGDAAPPLPTHHPLHNSSSSAISTSSHISSTAAPPSGATTPPYISSYKSPYSSMYSKSPGPSSAPIATQSSNTSPGQSTSINQQAQQASTERGQWPLSPLPVAAAAMLSSVYESAPDMNPLKRKKLSSISSMLMNRDTPILRNVLAQANSADSSSQPMQLMLPGAIKSEKSTTEKSASHAATSMAAAAAAGEAGRGTGVVGNSGQNNHSFNGSDYSSDKYPDEPHSPYTDRSFDDDAYDSKGNFSANYGTNANQKPEWKRYKQYTRNDIMSAIQCVRDGMSALQASRKFGVPSRTLYDKVKKLGITTGRPMNRTLKRSPSSVDTAASFPYSHGYGQSEPLLASMHEARNAAGVGSGSAGGDRSGGGGGGMPNTGDEHEANEHHRSEHHPHMPTGLPHPAAALLDNVFLQQALENRGGDIAGREALHAMALAAAAHAAANQQRMATSPGPNNGNPATRTPSPGPFPMKYPTHGGGGGHHGEREREREREHERFTMEREKERMLLENEMERERERERKRERERERGRERERERSRDRLHEREMDYENERRHHATLSNITAPLPPPNTHEDMDEDMVEDLSVTRNKDCSPPPPPSSHMRAATPNAAERQHSDMPRFSPQPSRSPPPPSLPPSAPTTTPSTASAVTPENLGSVIVPPMNTTKLPLSVIPLPLHPTISNNNSNSSMSSTSNNDDSSYREEHIHSPTLNAPTSTSSATSSLSTALKRELMSDDARTD